LNEQLSIETPENILLDADIAGYGTRCIAAIVDYLILLIVLVGASILFLQSVPVAERTDGRAVAIVVMIQFVLITFYHLFFELFWNGQTPGKRIVGIRVVQATGLPLTATGTIIRNLVRVFDFFPLFYGLGLIVMFVTRHTQRLGDLAAGTIVIREQRQLTMNTLKEDYTVTYHYTRRIEPLPPYIRIDNLTPDDRRIVVDYLRRRDSLRDRHQIAFMLARRMSAKMEDGGPPTFISGPYANDIFLEQIARAFELAQLD
jgi:uncharacterized RDD family membrane protein YckC